MVRISVDNVNRVAPYKVSAARLDGFVNFTTCSGVEYLAGFEKTDVLTCAETYEFVIINVNRKKSPRDHKLRDTIMAIVIDFFTSSNNVMLYICDTGDNKQSMRDRLFGYWIEHEPHHNEFSVYSASVSDEGVTNYATLILRKDHPKKNEAVDEFMETVKLLNDKPDTTER